MKKALGTQTTQQVKPQASSEETAAKHREPDLTTYTDWMGFRCTGNSPEDKK